ncbi:MAG: undecaprenyl-phosphate glucose phosphotransferase [Burkholderiales bacterium]|nr:undecaprenyl-phosphate glucose phosphotransferase [Burkholderiales bacterium]
MQHAVPALSALRAGVDARTTAPLPPFVAFLNSLLCPSVIVASLALCTIGYGETFSGYYLLLAVLVFLISSQVLDEFDLFLPWRILELARVTRAVVVGWAVVVGIVLFLGYATQLTDQFAYHVILTWFALTPVLLLASIKLARMVVKRVVTAGTMARTAVIVGANDLGRAFATRLRDTPYLSVRPLGFFDDRAPARIGIASGELLGRTADVPAYVRQHGVHCVYISLPIAAQPRILQLIQELRDTTASVYFLPDFFVFDLVAARFDYVSGIPVVAICETPYQGVNAVLKRAMDLVLATAIVVLAAPVMLAIALAVKLDSPGPALFRQRRYGMDGSEIVVFKFRTMKVTQDGGNVPQARRDDPRITRLGRFLRRTSLDELPQFFNVLGGSMSIVGPRPHAIAHNEQYRKLVPGYMLRHKVKPGITGWAQVNGFRGETETVEKMKGRVDLDIDYLNNWSPSLDLWIIIRTVGCVWKDRNAY